MIHPEVPLSSKSKYAALLLSSVLVIYAIVGGKFGRVSAQDTSIQQLDVFNQVYAKVKNDYVDQPSMTAAMVGAIRGLLEQVDPYSGYLNPKDVAFYKDFSVEKTPGIGVILTKANGYPTILGSDSRRTRRKGRTEDLRYDRSYRRSPDPGNESGPGLRLSGKSLG